jgi:hypothetical protein
LVRPVTVALSVEPSTAAVRPSGFEVTVYCVIGLPPSDDGAIHATVAVAFPAMAVTPVGASGGPVGVTPLEGADGTLVPTTFVATTVNV